MELQIIVQWVIASGLWCAASHVLFFNIRRHSLNQRRLDQGDQSQISGIAFLATIFALLGFAVAPMEFSLWFCLIAFVELPAQINFSGPPVGEAETQNDDIEETEGLEFSAETPPVQALLSYLQTHDLVLNLLPHKSCYLSINWQEIEVIFEKYRFVVPVFDEFNDTAVDNPVLWFHLVLETCEYFEDTANYVEWLSDNGLKDVPVSQQLYDVVKAVVPELRSLLSEAPSSISDHDIELNTHVAKDLRACELRSS
jgi:hypothetical protein